MSNLTIWHVFWYSLTCNYSTCKTSKDFVFISIMACKMKFYSLSLWKNCEILLNLNHFQIFVQLMGFLTCGMAKFLWNLNFIHIQLHWASRDDEFYKVNFNCLRNFRTRWILNIIVCRNMDIYIPCQLPLTNLLWNFQEIKLKKKWTCLIWT